MLYQKSFIVNMYLCGCLCDPYNQVIKAFAQRYVGSSTGLSGAPPPSI